MGRGTPRETTNRRDPTFERLLLTGFDRLPPARRAAVRDAIRRDGWNAVESLIDRGYRIWRLGHPAPGAFEDVAQEYAGAFVLEALGDMPEDWNALHWERCLRRAWNTVDPPGTNENELVSQRAIFTRELFLLQGLFCGLVAAHHALNQLDDPAALFDPWEDATFLLDFIRTNGFRYLTPPGNPLAALPYRVMTDQIADHLAELDKVNLDAVSDAIREFRPSFAVEPPADSLGRVLAAGYVAGFNEAQDDEIHGHLTVHGPNAD